MSRHDGFGCTDAGNALRFARDHGQDVRYVGAWGWLIWDGKRFARDLDGQVVERAKTTALTIYDAAREANSEVRRKELAKWATTSESVTRIKAMVELAKSDPRIAARVEDFDTDPFAFNAANGVLDLRTGQLGPHRRELNITKLSPTSYDADAPAPLWTAFHERVLPDPDVRSFDQRGAGYGLTGSTREQCLFMPHGTGANGKSVRLRVLAGVMGEDYARTADASSFMVQRGDGPRNDIARLAGVRLVTSIEIEEGRRMAESLVKALTGGDRISARFLFREHFEFMPAFKLWLAVNHRPVIRETGHAMWRRIHLIPFNVVIPQEERDPDLGDKLMVEASGILAWAVRGCLEWQERGLRPPSAVQAATRAYEAESDQLGAFLDEECEIHPHHVIGASELYERFREWAGREGEGALSHTMFGRRLTDRGFGTDKRGPGKAKRRLGLRLRDASMGTVGNSLEQFSGNSPHVRAQGKVAEKPVPTGNCSPDGGPDYEGEYLDLLNRPDAA